MAFVQPRKLVDELLDPANLKDRFINPRAMDADIHLRHGPELMLKRIAERRQRAWDARQVSSTRTAVGWSEGHSMMHLATVPTVVWDVVKMVEPDIMQNERKLVDTLRRHNEWMIGGCHWVD